MQDMLNKRLRELRKSRKLTFRRLGELTGLDPGNLSAMESGRRKLSVASAKKLATFYGVDLDFIYGISELDLCTSLQDKLNCLFKEYEIPEDSDDMANKRLACLKLILNIDDEYIDLALANLKLCSSKPDSKKK